MPEIICPDCKQDLKATQDSMRCDSCDKNFEKQGNLLLLNDKLLDETSDVRTPARENGELVFDNAFSRDFLYKSTAELSARQVSYHKFFHSDAKIKEAVESVLEAKQGGQTLDIGCGLGIPMYSLGPNVLEHENVTGIDLSLSLLQEANYTLSKTGRQNLLCLVNGQSLPFKDRSFDLVLARNMLYHVSDINGVCAEAKRTMKEDALFMTTTNSEHGKQELFDIHIQTIKEISGKEVEIKRGAARFSLENGAEKLKETFPDVKQYSWSAYFKFPTCDDFMAYYESTPYYKKAFDDPQLQKELNAGVRKKVQTEIDNQGAFIMNNEGAVFICKKAA